MMTSRILTTSYQASVVLALVVDVGLGGFRDDRIRAGAEPSTVDWRPPSAHPQLAPRLAEIL
jgi:hypothetical protein